MTPTATVNAAEVTGRKRRCIYIYINIYIHIFIYTDRGSLEEV